MAMGMSLERELVFQSMDEGLLRQEILDRVEGMRELDVRMDSKKIEVALSQYNAKEELEKRGEYKRKFKDDLKDLIEKKKREIEDNYENLLFVRIKDGCGDSSCNNCEEYRIRWVSAKIKYLNGKGKIPVPQMEKKFLLEYCERCGYIEEKE